MKRTMLSLSLTLALALVLAAAGAAPAGAEETIKLAQPDFSKGMTVLSALKARKSDRIFGSGELSRQQLSEVLWAAAGVNRELGDGKVGRTAPTSHDDQSIDTYAFTKNGVYRYDPRAHELIQVVAGDQRTKAGVQSYVAMAPLNLIFVADLNRTTGDSDAGKKEALYMNVGHMSENVYIYAASAGLHVICRSSIEPDELRTLLKLNDNYVPLLGVTVGLPQ